MLVGLTALSEDKSIISLIDNLSAISQMVFVVKMLLYRPSRGFDSTRGTCLYAAAWYKLLYYDL